MQRRGDLRILRETMCLAPNSKNIPILARSQDKKELTCVTYLCRTSLTLTVHSNRAQKSLSWSVFHLQLGLFFAF
jgi:hypothetical protein